ncbi:ATP-binding protein [Oceaniserpentilla sp. 4NH20-0058]|uniref:ATP-binding protein n=1 Tax=Oceaniserpentilla sp. 4NH20-0058 TaxID=3127660 RepID=UPI00310C469F
MFGLTGRILFSFWLTLILVVIAMVIIFISQNDDEHEPHEFPPIKIAQTLTLKLLSDEYIDVQSWFAIQKDREIKRLFVINHGQEILKRSLPPALAKINKNLSSTSPFIHKVRRGFVFVGRQLLLPSGKTVNILVKSPHNKPPLHHVIADQWLGFVISACLISGLISYLLALYIMKPISHLRQATQKLSAGDLSIRVQDDIKSGRGEMSLLAQDFDDMADKLDRTMSSHKHLIQDISHELRSPVARLQLALELCKKRLKIPDDQVDMMRIEKECNQLNTIINTLLNLPAYELDPSLALQDTIDINQLLKSICHDLSFTHKDKPIELVIQHETGPNISGNTQLLRSALENILKNAQYYHQGDQHIKVTSEINNNALIITCLDNGPGVDTDKLEEIFKPFYRISQARERSSGGHGLGLAISKRAIELHRGNIQATHNTPQGLCVMVTLPLNNL